MDELHLPFHAGDLDEIRRAAETQRRFLATPPNSPEFVQARSDWQDRCAELGYMLILKFEGLEARKG